MHFRFEEFCTSSRLQKNCTAKSHVICTDPRIAMKSKHFKICELFWSVAGAPAGWVNTLKYGQSNELDEDRNAEQYQAELNHLATEVIII